MITIRPAGERGRTQIDWLDSLHSFSFGDYFDPKHHGFSTLRVINDDFVAAGAGFPTHPHRDMEIVTYVLAGALQHRDSMGNGSVIRPGDVQRMSAGSGVTHSEYNPSPTEPVHLLQIWIRPGAKGIAPGYEQKTFPTDTKRGRLVKIAAGNGATPPASDGDGPVTLHTDAAIYAAVLDPKQTVEHRPAPGRRAWVQVAAGVVELNGQRLSAGDGAALENEPLISLSGVDPAEVLVFDLP